MSEVDIFSALGSALYGRLGTVLYTYNAGTAMLTNVTLPTYNTVAPQGTNPPYVIFQFQDLQDIRAMSAKPGNNAFVVVKAVSDRLYPTMQGYPIYATAHNAMQGAALSVPGMTLMRCDRASLLPPYQDSANFWHVGGMYRVDTWQADDDGELAA